MRFECPSEVRFRCNMCAMCCGDVEKKTRNILLLRTEARKIADETSGRIKDFADRALDCRPYAYSMKKTSEGKCFFLSKNRCSIYAVRPLICRFYPFELRNSGNEVFFFLASEECPRLGKGPRLTRQHFKQLFKHFAKVMEKNRL